MLPLLTGCGFLSAPATRFELAAEWQPLLAAEPELGEWARTTLEEHFGTPRGPRFLILDEWQQRGFDPNRPQVALGHGGSGEIGAQEWELIRAGNRERFRDELEELAQGEPGEPGEIGPWATAPDLSDDWAALLEERDSSAWRARAETLLVDHYPSLRDSATLYAKRCLTCHGNEGGGDGPGSRFLRPVPRDFRQGVFKFTAVADHGRPRRTDLVRVITEGIDNTAMPSFSGYSPAELHGLADYVRLLSMRGETELWWIGDLAQGDEVDATAARDAYRAVFEDWWNADTREIPLGTSPPVDAELLQLGERLFRDPTRGNCASCHGDEGRGDGPAVRDETTGTPFRDAWGEVIVPRDLVRGPLRYGDAPEDLYRRIYAGINGTPMPGIGGVNGADGQPLLGERDLWALVHHVRALRGLGATPSGPGH